MIARERATDSRFPLVVAVAVVRARRAVVVDAPNPRDPPSPAAACRFRRCGGTYPDFCGDATCGAGTDVDGFGIVVVVVVVGGGGSPALRGGKSPLSSAQSLMASSVFLCRRA